MNEQEIQARLKADKAERTDTYHMSKTGGSTPKQYGIPENAKDLQDLIEHRNMNFAIGNIFKACYRLGMKEDVSIEYDLNKMKWFIDREIERIKKCH